MSVGVSAERCNQGNVAWMWAVLSSGVHSRENSRGGLCKHEDLSLDPQRPGREPSIVCARDPRTRGGDRRLLGLTGQSVHQSIHFRCSGCLSTPEADEAGPL